MGMRYPVNFSDPAKEYFFDPSNLQKLLEINFVNCTSFEEYPSNVEIVYFLKCNDSIKIGTSKIFQKRLKQHKDSNPHLHPVGYILGGYDIEKEIHSLFTYFIKQGREWFAAVPPLTWIGDDSKVQVIKNYADGHEPKDIVTEVVVVRGAYYIKVKCEGKTSKFSTGFKEDSRGTFQRVKMAKINYVTTQMQIDAACNLLDPTFIKYKEALKV
jgi:hypothetical protein